MSVPNFCGIFSPSPGENGAGSAIGFSIKVKGWPVGAAGYDCCWYRRFDILPSYLGKLSWPNRRGQHGRWFFYGNIMEYPQNACNFGLGMIVIFLELHGKIMSWAMRILEPEPISNVAQVFWTENVGGGGCLQHHQARNMLQVVTTRRLEGNWLAISHDTSALEIMFGKLEQATSFRLVNCSKSAVGKSFWSYCCDVIENL